MLSKGPITLALQADSEIGLVKYWSVFPMDMEEVSLVMCTAGDQVWVEIDVDWILNMDETTVVASADLAGRVIREGVAVIQPWRVGGTRWICWSLLICSGGKRDDISSFSTNKLV